MGMHSTAQAEARAWRRLSKALCVDALRSEWSCADALLKIGTKTYHAVVFIMTCYTTIVSYLYDSTVLFFQRRLIDQLEWTIYRIPHLTLYNHQRGASLA